MFLHGSLYVFLPKDPPERILRSHCITEPRRWYDSHPEEAACILKTILVHELISASLQLQPTFSIHYNHLFEDRTFCVQRGECSPTGYTLLPLVVVKNTQLQTTT